MGLFINQETRAIIQGIAGTQGRFHTQHMLQYGTRVVAGTSPGKGGTVVHGVPVYDTVGEAQAKHGPDASVVFVPAPFAMDAALEALESGIKTIVMITEHIPVKDSVYLMAYAKEAGATIIGPNSPGVIAPGACKLGIMPAHMFSAGSLGVVSRSGTLTYEIAGGLTRRGMGQSTCVGLGGDPVTGLNFVDMLKLFRQDPETEAVVLVGEIGGNLEELAAEYIRKERYPKPVVAFIAGRSAPPEKQMGHAGAITMGNFGSAVSKIAAFEDAGIHVAVKPSDLTILLEEAGFGAKGISER